MSPIAAAIALAQMESEGRDWTWINIHDDNDKVTRWECERILGINDEG